MKRISTGPKSPFVSHLFEADLESGPLPGSAVFSLFASIFSKPLAGTSYSVHFVSQGCDMIGTHDRVWQMIGAPLPSERVTKERR